MINIISANGNLKFIQVSFMICDWKFYRMHSCFNQFVIIDMRMSQLRLKNLPQIAKTIAGKDEKMGIDQVLTITNSTKADCKVIIYNADGSESDMCANGLRCVGRLIAEETNRNENTIEVSGIIYKASRKSSTIFSINIGKPKLSWQAIPLAREMSLPILEYSFGEFKNPIVLSLGNPHAVFFVEQKMFEEINLYKIGKQIENDPLFLNRINVSFVRVLDKNNVEAKVWERGAGATKSCGSAATAIAWAAIFKGSSASPINIHFGSDRTILVEQLEDGSMESSAKTHILDEKISSSHLADLSL